MRLGCDKLQLEAHLQLRQTLLRASLRSVCLWDLRRVPVSDWDNAAFAKGGIRMNVMPDV